MIKWPKSMKARLKELRAPILEQMVIEQAFQAELRTTMITSMDDDEVKEARVLFDESVKHWKVLKDSLKEYEGLVSKKLRVSPDTLVIVGGQLLLGVLVLIVEDRGGLVRSKAMNFLPKGRV